MTPFKNITRPVSVDFFSIYEEDGEKYIHIHGYTYESDGSDDFTTPENPNGRYWANMEACGIILPVSELLAEFEARGEEALEFVDELYCDASQYQGDYDDDGIVNVINHYYRDIVFSVDGDNGEGTPDAYLSFGDITLDTPCGKYVTYPAYEDIEL